MAATLTPKNPWLDNSTSIYDNYEQARNLLLFKSAGLTIVFKNLKKLHGLDKFPKAKLVKELYKATTTNSKLGQDLKKICESLEIIELLLIDFISNNFKDANVPQKSLPLYSLVEDPKAPEALFTVPKGSYIRVYRHTREETVLRTFKLIRYALDLIELSDKQRDLLGGKLTKQAEAKLFKQALKSHRKVRNTPLRNLEKKKDIYFAVEKTIKDQLKYPDQSGDDSKKILTSAFEFVSEEHPTYGSPKQVENSYRAILEYYKLPPLREFQNLLSR